MHQEFQRVWKNESNRVIGKNVLISFVHVDPPVLELIVVILLGVLYILRGHGPQMLQANETLLSVLGVPETKAKRTQTSG